MRGSIGRTLIVAISTGALVAVVAVPSASARSCEVNANSGASTLDLFLIRLHRARLGASGFCYDDIAAAARSAAPYACRVYAEAINLTDAIPSTFANAATNDPVEEFCHTEGSALQLPRCAQWYVEASIQSGSIVYDIEDDYPVICGT